MEEECPNCSQKKLEILFEENNTKKSKKKKFEEPLKISFKNFSFGLVKISLIALLTTILFQGLFTVIQLYQKPKAEFVTNLLKVYILGADTWDSFAMLHTFFMETILFNNTAPCWVGRKSLGCYQQVRDYMNNVLILNISESAGYELGNFSQNFSETLTSVNFQKKFKEIQNFFF